MRRLLAVAPIVLAAFVSAPFLLRAQRGGGHTGFSGHSSSSFHAGFSGSAFHGGGFSSSGPAFRGFSPGGFAGAPRYGFTAPSRYSFSAPRYGTPFTGRFSPSARAPFGRRPNFTAGFAGNRAGISRAGSSFGRSGFASGDRHRPPYRSPYRGRNRYDRNNFPYSYYAYPDFYSYPPVWDDEYLFDNTEANAPQESNPQDYNSQPPNQQPQYPEPPAWPSLNAPQSTALSQISPPPPPTEAVTLVFNDRRPLEKIHNYLLTPTTLFVMDQHRSEIPVDELNLAATAKVNREAGIDFKLPSPSK